MTVIILWGPVQDRGTKKRRVNVTVHMAAVDTAGNNRAARATEIDAVMKNNRSEGSPVQDESVRLGNGNTMACKMSVQLMNRSSSGESINGVLWVDVTVRECTEWVKTKKINSTVGTMQANQSCSRDSSLEMR